MTNPQEVLNILDARRQRARSKEPKIRINQRWIAYDSAGDVFRRIRILAEHPDGGWIYCDEQAKMKRTYIGPYNMGVCPEFNLRYVFELEGED